MQIIRTECFDYKQIPPAQDAIDARASGGGDFDQRLQFSK